jgi:COMPASS component SPP1
MPASNSLPVVSNNKPGFKYKYPEAAPTPPGEDDVEWNKVYTAADSRFYNRNGKSADRSRKYRQSGETYLLAIEMMAEKKEKLKAGGAGSKAAAKPKPLKKGPAVVKTEASNSSRDGTPCIDRVPMSISEQIKSEGRARNKAPSAAPSSKQGTPVPVPLPGVKTGSPPPKIEKPPPKKKGTAAPVKKPTKPKGPGKYILPSTSSCYHLPVAQ